MNLKRIVVLATWHELTDYRYYESVWRILKDLQESGEISSRSVEEKASFILLMNDVLVTLSTGEIASLREILESVLTEDSSRSFRHYMETDYTGRRPRRYCWKRLDRLAVWDLVCRVYWPERMKAVMHNLNPHFQAFLK